MQVLHITPHLGGGVGKALSGLAVQAIRSRSEFNHVIVCLETPQKTQFIDKIRNSGGEVVISPEPEELQELMSEADIVQLEWWPHPATISMLGSLSAVPIRLLTWWHQSGLHSPLPKQLMRTSHTFLFTSSCTYDHPKMKSLIAELRDRLGVVYSSGGFEGIPDPRDRSEDRLSAGYVGMMEFRKLHPKYVEYISAVDIPGFSVKMIGEYNNPYLRKQCSATGKPGLLQFTGFVPDIVPELESINVFAYLLNPNHYGTTENALLEAMAMGIVPVVLNNPAERCIVEDGVTGMIVHSPEEFAQAIRWLSDHPHERQAIGMQAAKIVRERFSVQRTEANLNKYYKKIMEMEKKSNEFKEIFRITG